MKILKWLARLFIRSTQQSDIGNLFTYEEFAQYVEWGACSETDGIGFYASANREYSRIKDINNLSWKYTHIMWYDK